MSWRKPKVYDSGLRQYFQPNTASPYYLMIDTFIRRDGPPQIRVILEIRGGESAEVLSETICKPDELEQILAQYREFGEIALMEALL